MKLTINLLISTFLILTNCLYISGAAHPEVSARMVYVGLSPYYNSYDRENVRTELENLILTAPQRTRFVISDAYNGQTIVDEFEIPVLKVDTRITRSRFLRLPLARLLSWFQRTAKESPPELLANTSAVKIPEYLEQVAGQQSSGPRSVLCIGSPLYICLTEASFSMPPNKCPAHAHLVCDLAGSPYGIAGKGNRLAGVFVHIWYLKEGLWYDQLYKQTIHNFWGLFVTGQSGILASFGPDGGRILASVTCDNLPPTDHYRLDRTQNKVEMRIVLRTNDTTTITQKVDTVDFSSILRANNHEGSDQAILGVMQQAVQTNQTAIGIMWSQPRVDLDLYVWPRSESALPLFFQNTVAPEGRYIHDYRDRNDQLKDYEFVVLSWSGIDLSKEALVTISTLVAGTCRNGEASTVGLAAVNQDHLTAQAFRM